MTSPAVGSESANPLVLVGDVGGTKTVLSFARLSGTRLSTIDERIFPTRQYRGLEPMLDEFFGASTHRASRAVFSVAGPVAAGRSQISNLGWSVDAERLRDRYSLDSVDLLNDVEAMAVAVPRLDADARAVVVDGRAVPGGPIAVLAAGTGLGESMLFAEAGAGGEYRALPSEGGNAAFAPANETQLELLRFLLASQYHVSVEQVCSGIGIPNVYRFLKETARAREPEALGAALRAADDPVPLIVEGATSATPYDICVKTVDLVAEILAGEAANLAIRLLATGGVYIGGGIPPRILPFLRNPAFASAFHANGRFTRLLMDVPVFVVLDSRAPLLGAIHHVAGAGPAR